MNKSVLVGAGLFSLLCSPIFAQDAIPSMPQTTTPDSAPSSNSSSSSVTTPTIIQGGTSNTPNQAPNTAPATPNDTTNPAANTAPSSTTTPATPTDSSNSTNTTTPPDTSTPADTSIPSATSTSTESATPTAANPALNCSFHIPAETTTVDTNLVMQWAEKAAQQTFALDPSMLDAPLATLKTCYTDQGWQSFNEALKKSGNLNAIKKENLTVSSMLDGVSTVTALKDNQWKVAVPLQVVYQNGKEKILQALTINLIVTRKVSGDLGVMQVVAMPRVSTSNPAADTAPATASPASSSTTPAQGASPETTTPAAAE